MESLEFSQVPELIWGGMKKYEGNTGRRTWKNSFQYEGNTGRRTWKNSFGAFQQEGGGNFADTIPEMAPSTEREGGSPAKYEGIIYGKYEGHMTKYRP